MNIPTSVPQGVNSLTPSIEPFREVINFADLVQEIKYALTGIKWVADVTGYETKDGVTVPTYGAPKKVTDNEVTPICNEKGANYLVMQVAGLLNRAVATGNLKERDIGNFVADVVGSSIATLLVSDHFGVIEPVLLLNYEMTLLKELHSYMTSITRGARLEFGRSTVAINYNDMGQQQAESLSDKVNGLFGNGR